MSVKCTSCGDTVLAGDAVSVRGRVQCKTCRARSARRSRRRFVLVTVSLAGLIAFAVGAISFWHFQTTASEARAASAVETFVQTRIIGSGAATGVDYSQTSYKILEMSNASFARDNAGDTTIKRMVKAGGGKLSGRSYRVYLYGVLSDDGDGSGHKSLGEQDVELHYGVDPSSGEATVVANF